MKTAVTVTSISMVAAQAAFALTVQVVGRSTPVRLDAPNFSKYELPHGNAINAVYYDSQNQYAVYQERTLFQHRCEVPADVIDEWVADGASDSYYERKIDDRYDCNSNNTPAY